MKKDRWDEDDTGALNIRTKQDRCAQIHHVPFSESYVWHWWTQDHSWQLGGTGTLDECKYAAEKHIGLRPTAWERITST